MLDYGKRRTEQMIKYRTDVLAALSAAGYTQYRMNKEKIMASSTITKLRNGDQSLTLATLDVICRLTGLQPADLIEYVED